MWKNDDVVVGCSRDEGWRMVVEISMMRRDEMARTDGWTRTKMMITLRSKRRSTLKHLIFHYVNG